MRNARNPESQKTTRNTKWKPDCQASFERNMTHFKVHRIRFVEFKPEAIHCLAFEGNGSSRLAISRQDGTIEIWNTALPRWTKDFVIPSQLGRSVESLTWCGNRLFSSGLGGDITEWDLEELVEKIVVDSNGGPVWSSAANHKGDLLAAGCEDGAVRLFSIEGNNLELCRVLDKQEYRILSLAWSHCDSIIVTGSTDSSIQVYDLKSRRIISRISTDKIKDRSTLIWSVYLTKDMTIISGDSTGQTQFWDANVGTLLQGFKSHGADVLTVCVNENEDTVYSSGIDSRITEFKLYKEAHNDYGEWRLTKKVKAVCHDIRAIAISPDYIVAGGVDPRLIRFDSNSFERRKFTSLSPFTLNPQCCIASKGNLLIFPEKNALHIWKLPCLTDIDNQAPKKLLELKSCRTQHITSCDVSSDGSVIVFSDIKGLSAFNIYCSTSPILKPHLEVSKIKINQNALIGIQKVKVIADGNKIVFAGSHGVGIIDLNSDESSVTYLSNGAFKSIKHPWMLLAVNNEETLIAAVDGTFTTYIYSIAESKCLTKLPQTEHKPVAIAFQPGTPNLVQASSDKTIQIYNIETEKFDQWASKLNKTGCLNDVPSRNSLFLSIFFNPENPQEMFLQSENGFVKINMGAELDVYGNQNAKHSKRKFEELYNNVVKVCKKYSPLLYCGVTAEKSLVVVERPIFDIISSLPPALKLKKYGT